MKIRINIARTVANNIIEIKIIIIPKINGFINTPYFLNNKN
jgi:hypothetical protein